MISDYEVKGVFGFFFLKTETNTYLNEEMNGSCFQIGKKTGRL